MKNKTLHLIVNCTKSKSLPVSNLLMVRSIKDGFIEDACSTWLKRISHNTQNFIKALDLYAGGFWKVVKSIDSLGKDLGVSVKIWVCSGGYGLISGQSMISPYSATFTDNHLDSISRFKLRHTNQNPKTIWWNQISEWEGPDKAEHRKISDLIEKNEGSPIWMVISNEYLKAISSDLNLLNQNKVNLDCFALFSTGLQSFEGFDDNIIPFDARFQKVLGGSMGSLNIRIAKKALENIKIIGSQTNKIKRFFLSEMNSIPRYVSLKRKPKNDREVADFIRNTLVYEPNMNFTPLLRLFRDSGFACEYSRFFKIYSHVKGELNEF
jgi:hypothetical protein